MRLIAGVMAVFLAGAAPAKQAVDPAEAARAAAQRLSRAGALLEAAERADNRVKALTEAIRAYEAGLEAMREGMRRAAIREQMLSRDLAVREQDVARLLGVLQSIAMTPPEVLLLHPDGPLGTARSAMMVAEVTPALRARAEALQDRLQEVTTLRALQKNAAQKLRKALEAAQTARAELSQAIADRKKLPRRFVEDPKQTALLIAATDTLDGFASGLGNIAVNEVPGSLPPVTNRKGDLPLPVKGTILRRAGEADAAGITRPGIVVATRPHALVTIPVPATVRYRGPLLDYGNVMILEPQAGILLVMAGLDVVYGQAGEVLPGGSPVGLMGGPEAGADGLLLPTDSSAGARQTQTLYIEVREDNSPVDPETWFRTDKG